MADCRFKIWTEVEAWKCMDGKWLLMNGDSNHVDTAYNLLYSILGMTKMVDEDADYEREHPGSIYCPCVDHNHGRTFDVRPRKNGMATRISNVFNGHATDDGNDMGMATYRDAGRRGQLSGFFLGESKPPDVFLLNSGLHDTAETTTAGIGPRTVDYHLKQIDTMLSFFANITQPDKTR
jgi:hypothetical protein